MVVQQEPVGARSRKRTILRIALSVIVGVVLIVAGALYFVSHNHGTVAFKIGNHSYYKKDVDRLVDYPTHKLSMSKKLATTRVAEALQTIQIVEDAKITIDPQEIDFQKKSFVINRQGGANGYKWFDLLAKEAAAKKYIGNTALLGYKGYSFDFYFGQHIQSGASYTPAGLNDAKLIAEDREQAKEQANYYHDQIQNKKLTLDEALKKVYTDPNAPKLPGGVSTTTSKKFGYTEGTNWADEVKSQSIVDFITTQHRPGLSTVKTGKASGYSGQSQKQYPGVYYYFVDLDQVGPAKNISQKTFTAKQSQAKIVYEDSIK